MGDGSGNENAKSKYGSNDITVLEYIETLIGGSVEHLIDFSISLSLCKSGQKYLDGSPIEFIAFFPTSATAVESSLLCRFYIPDFFHLIFSKYGMGGAFREYATHSDSRAMVADLLVSDNVFLETKSTLDPFNHNTTLFKDLDFGADIKVLSRDITEFLSGVKKAELVLYLLDTKFSIRNMPTPDKFRIKSKI